MIIRNKQIRCISILIVRLVKEFSFTKVFRRSSIAAILVTAHTIDSRSKQNNRFSYAIHGKVMKDDSAQYPISLSVVPYVPSPGLVVVFF